jgi:hypothetical protein
MYHNPVQWLLAFYYRSSFIIRRADSRADSCADSLVCSCLAATHSVQNNNKKWQDAEETEMHKLLAYHRKGVAIDFAACEQCSSLFGGESAFDYTPEIEIAFDYTHEIELYFEK